MKAQKWFGKKWLGKKYVAKKANLIKMPTTLRNNLSNYDIPHIDSIFNLNVFKKWRVYT